MGIRIRSLPNLNQTIADAFGAPLVALFAPARVGPGESGDAVTRAWYREQGWTQILLGRAEASQQNGGRMADHLAQAYSPFVDERDGAA